MHVWVSDMHQHGEIGAAKTPWTTVIVQWETGPGRVYYRGGTGRWDVDVFLWREKAPATAQRCTHARPMQSPLNEIVRWGD